MPLNAFNLKKWVDENREPIPERVEPCGLWGLFSHRTIDDTVSRGGYAGRRLILAVAARDRALVLTMNYRQE